VPDRRGVRRLAVAVLQRAAFDAAGLIDTSTWGANPRLRAERRGRVQADAYDWLTTPGVDLEFWSEAAGIGMRDVIDGADSAVAYALKRARVMAARRSSTTWTKKGD
jgi:hypothetical protein